MAKSRVQKTEALDELTKLFKDSKSIMFSDYQGMTVSKMTDLRKQLSNAKVDYVVAKKTLLALAAKEAGYDVDFSKITGMIGVAFSHEDEMAGAKLVGDAAKDATTPITLVGGVFDGKVIDASYAVALSKLPSKQALLGQLLSVLNGPASAFARLLDAKAKKEEATA